MKQPPPLLTATVVLYQRRPDQSDTLATLDATCAAACLRIPVLVYDNSKEATHGSKSWAGRYPSLDIEYIHDPRNPGVSRAYNVGLKRCISNGAEWMLILDQDSRLDVGFVRATLGSVAKLPQSDLHLPEVHCGGRIVSPVRLVLGRSVGHRGLRAGAAAAVPFFAVNSGMLVRAEYLTGIGGWDERFKLYFTDNWFCDTYHAARKQFAVTGASIEHNLSVQTSRDPDHQVWLYQQAVQGSRALYRRRPLILASITLTGVAGAFKRSLTRRDARYLHVFLGLERFGRIGDDTSSKG